MAARAMKGKAALKSDEWVNCVDISLNLQLCIIIFYLDLHRSMTGVTCGARKAHSSGAFDRVLFFHHLLCFIWQQFWLLVLCVPILLFTNLLGCGFNGVMFTFVLLNFIIITID